MTITTLILRPEWVYVWEQIYDVAAVDMFIATMFSEVQNFLLGTKSYAFVLDKRHGRFTKLKKIDLDTIYKTSSIEKIIRIYATCFGRRKCNCPEHDCIVWKVFKIILKRIYNYIYRLLQLCIFVICLLFWFYFGDCNIIPEKVIKC